MKRNLPIVNRRLQQKEIQRNNEVLLNKIYRLKFSNFTSLHCKKSSASLLKYRNTPSVQRMNSQFKQQRSKTETNERRVQVDSSNTDEILNYQKETFTHRQLVSSTKPINRELPKRSERYPYKRSESSKNSDPFMKSRTLGQLNKAEPSFNNKKVQIKPKILIQTSKQFGMSQRIFQQQNRQHVIVLWNQVFQLQKIWYMIKFLRFKNHYQIQFISQQQQNILYTIKMAEQVGTRLLTQNDYNYQYISTNYIKFTPHAIFITFYLENGPEKVKHNYKFERTVIKGDEIKKDLEIYSNIKPKIQIEDIQIKLNFNPNTKKLQYIKQQVKHKQIYQLKTLIIDKFSSLF